MAGTVNNAKISNEWVVVYSGSTVYYQSESAYTGVVGYNESTRTLAKFSTEQGMLDFIAAL